MKVKIREFNIKPIAVHFGRNSNDENRIKNEIKNAIKKGCQIFDVESSEYNLKNLKTLINDYYQNQQHQENQRGKIIIAIKFNYSKNFESILNNHIISNEIQENDLFEYIYYLDYIPNLELLGGVAGKIQQLIEGKNIKGWGLCNANFEQIQQCNELLHLTFVKNEYIIKNEILEKEIVLCKKLDILFIAYPIYISKKLLEKMEENTENIYSRLFCVCFWRNIKYICISIAHFFCFKCYDCKKCYKCCLGKERESKVKLKKVALLYMSKENNIFIPMLPIEEFYCNKDGNDGNISNYLEQEVNKEEFDKIKEIFKIKQRKIITSILSIICCIISCICSIIVIFINNYVKNIKYDSEISGAISNMLLENFETGYYTNFRKCSSSYNNYDTLRLLKESLLSFGRWEGTIKGCGNKDTLSVKKLEKETCDSNEEILQSISARNIYSYKGITICAETKEEYLDLLLKGSIIKSNVECMKGKKNCGYIDTLNNILCINIDEECPINFIEFSDEPPKNVSNLNEIKGNGINFYFSNNPYPNSNKIPKIISSFRIGDSYLCSIPSLYKPNIDLFELEVFKNGKDHSIECILSDFLQRTVRDTQRYEKFDEIDNYMLYEENQIINAIQNSNLINYGFNINNYKNNILYLYGRTHLGFDKECLDNRQTKFNKQHLTLIFSRAEKMRIYGKNMLWSLANIICQFLDIVTQIIDLKIQKELNWIILTSQIFEKFGGLSTSIYLIIKSEEAISYDDPYEDEMKCSDDLTNDNYNIMVKKLHNAGKKIKFSYGLLIAVIICNIVSIILHFIIKLNEKKIQDEKEQIENLNEKKDIIQVNYNMEENTIIGDNTEKNSMKKNNN